ncbi:hypothetical protein V6Z11_D04G030000 [Gossypium hirsutum]
MAAGKQPVGGKVSVSACNKRHSIQDTRRRMRGSLTHDEMLSSCLIKRLVILSRCIDIVEPFIAHYVFALGVARDKVLCSL